MRFATSIVPACVLAAFFGGTEARAQDQEPLVIEVNMADYSFSPAPLRIPAGRPVTLVFSNTGDVDHEFMAGRTVANGDFELDLFAGLEVDIQAVAPADHADAAPHEHAPRSAPRVAHSTRVQPPPATAEAPPSRPGAAPP